MANVIVFGASGAVGSAAAIEARKRGAKVWLAMRDTSKTIQQLDEEEEKGGYERVQADCKYLSPLRVGSLCPRTKRRPSSIGTCYCCSGSQEIRRYGRVCVYAVE